VIGAAAAAAQQQQRGPVRRVSRTGPSEGFERPPEIPWSQLAPEFIETWMPRADPFEGEHMEVSGQSGSGKSYALATLLHMRALDRDTPTIYICTKKDDNTVKRLSALGWPICRSFDDLKRYRQSIYWPQTPLMGRQRKAFHETRIYDLLSRLWVEQANTIVVFDEIGYVESLSADLRELVQQYWREARSIGIGVVASKQRPVGVARDQHSESRWKIVFPPAHFADMEAFAELLGRPGDWQPVLESLDQRQHQFIIRNNVSRESFISWIDFDLDLMRLLEQDKRMSPSEKLYGRRIGQRVG
jgi:hypothetical protein